MTSRLPRIIIIDEPNSFLHPAAVRALIRILKEYPQHQYIISTHAAELVSAIEPEKLMLIRWEGKETKAVVHSGKDLTAVKAALDEGGARLSDVFGRDMVVWVEGPVEAACFPFLASTNSAEDDARKIAWIPIVNTGDLEAKRGNPELAWRVYERISQQSVLLPETLAFSLDREGRSEKFRDDLQRRSGGRIRFLPRRTYENYLLHPAAIAAVMPEKKTEEEISSWLRNMGGKKPYYEGQWDGNIDDTPWLQTVDAPNLTVSRTSDCGTVFRSRDI